jgi:hypothetical protein
MASKGFVGITFVFDPIDDVDGPMIFAAILLSDFDIGKATSKHFHLVFLDRFTKTMVDIPGSHFDIIGTASMSGAAAFNRALSQHRADNIMADLRGRGASKEQIQSDQGIGSVFSPVSKEDFHGRAVLVMLKCPPSSADEMHAFETAWNADPLKKQAAAPQ